MFSSMPIVTLRKFHYASSFLVNLAFVPSPLSYSQPDLRCVPFVFGCFAALLEFINEPCRLTVDCVVRLTLIELTDNTEKAAK